MEKKHADRMVLQASVQSDKWNPIFVLVSKFASWLHKSWCKRSEKHEGDST